MIGDLAVYALRTYSLHLVQPQMFQKAAGTFKKLSDERE